MSRCTCTIHLNEKESGLKIKLTLILNCTVQHVIYMYVHVIPMP